jgi:hypothetical protein
LAGHRYSQVNKHPTILGTLLASGWLAKIRRLAAASCYRKPLHAPNRRAAVDLWRPHITDDQRCVGIKMTR